MDKVIVERPRIGSRLPSRKKGYRKYIASVPLDELPKREPMLGRWKGRQKWLNEHLGPMRRFLRSNVGRPWNKVHQELCEHVNVNSAVQAHILEHIEDYVNQHIEIHGETILRTNGWYRRWLRHGELYVCPRTKILRTVRKPKNRKSNDRLVLSSRTLLRRSNQWWEIKLQKYPKLVEDQFDAWLDAPLSDIGLETCVECYQEKAFALSKRLITKNELKRLKSADIKRKAKKRKRRLSR